MPFIGPTVTNHIADQVALHVMRHQCRPDQIRSASSGCIRPMAKPTCLPKLFVPALNRRIRNLGLGLGRSVRGSNQQKNAKERRESVANRIWKAKPCSRIVNAHLAQRGF